MILLLILLLIVCIIAVMLIRTYRFTGKPADSTIPLDTEDIVPSQVVADKLAGAIACKTVSNSDPALVDWNEFKKLHEYLRKSFPKVHEVMEREVIGDYNLVYIWRGTDPSARPIGFLAHQDVVPVGDENDWKYPPFSGYDDGENIHGRGSNDMKHEMIMALEACERLIAEGFVPREDVYLCFGQNEEVSNAPEMTGADLIAETLKQRGIRFDCILDEGGTIVGGKMFGASRNFAVVGMAEKGFADFVISSEAPGGHSSRAPKETALGRVCRAAYRVESNPEKSKLLPLTEDTLKAMAPYMSNFALRFLVANLPLTKELLLKAASSNTVMRSMLTTTTALTMAEGSPQDNVLAQKPWVLVNSRILPGDTAESIRESLIRKIGDPKIEVNILINHQEQSISNYNTEAYRQLCRQVAHYYPGTVVMPYLQLGASDSRNYYRVCDNVYRFIPVLFENGDNYGAHKANEYIPKNILGRGVVFIMDFIKNYKGEKQ